MRLIFLLTVFVLGFYACNNDLSTIGQNLIYNSNQVEVQTITLRETGTIKIDSFITSSGRAGGTTPTLIMGRYQDEYSGTTIACPYFQVVPSQQPSIARRYSLDSVTFHFGYGGKIWGDTLRPTPQTFHLYQLKELPTLDTDHYDYFYNTDSVPVGDLLATTTFNPKRAPIEYAYFKIPITNYIQDLFKKMQYDDPIFRPSATSTVTPFYKFITYFKGLTIRPAETNNYLITLKTMADSLYMRFHYHEAETQYHFDLKLLTQNPVFNFNSIRNYPSSVPNYDLTTLTDQKKEVMFSEHDFAIAQGLAGYMIKIDIPEPEDLKPYKTVVKAELELKPHVWYAPPVALPQTLNVYYTNKYNDIKDIVSDGSKAITGQYIYDAVNVDNSRYIFNITDYYQQLVTTPNSETQRQLLFTIPDLSVSFNRVMLRDEPVLRVYYATYKD